MADFVAVIRRAVDNLSENTPENRAKVYDKARAAIRRQLEAITPPPAEDVIARQIDKLDAAIDEVEDEHAEALPPEEQEADRLMAELEALVGSESRPVSEAPAAAAPARAAPTPVTPSPRPETIAPVAPSPAAQDDVAADDDLDADADVDVDAGTDAETEPGKPPFISGDAHDDVFGLNETRPETRPTRQTPKKPATVRKSGSRAWIWVAALLVLVAGGTYAAWTQRDALSAMLGLDRPSVDVAQTTPPAPATETPAAPAAPVEQAEPETTPETPKPTETAALQDQPEDDPAASTTPGEDGKFTQRLGTDGVETDPGPAPETADAGPVEGRSVAGLTETAPVDTGNPATSEPSAENDVSTDSAEEGETAEADAPTAPAGEQADPAAPIGVSQKMFLYEERLDQQSPAVTEGSVVWSLVDDDDGAGPNDVAIRGELSSGENGFSALLTIKRNTDNSLPASHIIELVFALPPDFAGGSVDQVQRIAMKQTEQDQGSPLIAVPAQITQDFYMIALNDLKEASDQNTRLMRERNWIDIPVVYTNGRRALITLEKGASGVEVFNEALDIWAKR